MRARNDDGTILILTIGFVIIGMLLVWAVIDASAVFLDRRDLSSAVDGTALAAAQQVNVGAVYAQGVGTDLPLDPAAVQRAVEAYVAQNFPASRYPGWALSGFASGPDTVTVTGRRVVRLPVYGTVTVVARATATDRTGPPLP
jgi:Flp pilus assembly protein TadG